MHNTINHKSTSYAKGVDAEQVAIEYFEKHHYKILAKRVKTKYGEIDFVCNKDNCVVAVEVKYRRNRKTLYECIQPKQKKRISMALLEILHKYSADSYRIDVIYLSDTTINHVQNAFYIEDHINY